MLYRMRVINNGNAPYEIKMDARTLTDARIKAEQQGLVVLNIKPSHQWFHQNNKQFPLMLFCQEFRVLLEAGLSMTDVLDTLIQKETNPNNLSYMQKLLLLVKEGKTLSQAMSESPEVFPRLLVASVSTAETTGNLPEALSRYSEYSENVDLLKKRIVSASIYPAIVISFGLLVFAFLLMHVIPKFSTIYQSQVKEVTGSTQFLLWLARFSEQYANYMLIMMLIIMGGIIWLFQRPEMKKSAYDLLWKLPYVGEKMRLYHLARLYRTFAMLLKSGVTVASGIAMVSNMLGKGLQANLVAAKNLIAEGKSFSEAFHRCELTTPVALRLFRVGEKTGALDTMMAHAAAFHEEEMLRWVDKITKVLEPTLMAIIGILIGGLVLMMYLPIFDLASGLD